MTVTVTVPASMSSDGTIHTYTDDSSPTTGLDGGGHVARLVPLILDAVYIANYTVNTTNTNVTTTNTNVTLSSQWASLTSGQVAATDYSAKAYAVGGAGITNTSGKGAAKEWAILTTGTVDTVDYSSKAWAVGGTGVDTIGGSAKDWATKVTTVGNTGLKSAKSYAEDATTNGAAQVTLAAAQVTLATTQAENATNAAAAILGTSATSFTVGTGSKTFTTQSSKQFAAGQWVTISSTANIANYMFGQVTSYSSTSLIVNITAIGGSGTYADWKISISGIKGDTGSAGVVNTGNSTNITGIVKGNGSTLSAATVRTDYAEPTTALATGILKNTTTTGAHTIALAGTDYVVPSGALGTPTSGNLANCTFPTLNQNTSGTAVGLSATLAVGSGGTGATTLTGLVKGNGTSAMTAAVADIDYQSPLVSGTNIKSIGTTSLLGSGDLTSTLHAIALYF